MEHPVRKCAGCDKPAGDLQCPLSQAAGLTEEGFFCSQECFAKNFVAHRNRLFPSGVVRAKKSLAEQAKEREESAAERRERKRKKVLGAGAPATAAAAEAEPLAAVVPEDEDFSDDEQAEAYRHALDKELEKRSERPLWPFWPAMPPSQSGEGAMFGGAPAPTTPSMTNPAMHFPDSTTFTRADVFIKGSNASAPAHLHRACLFAAHTARNWTQAAMRRPSSAALPPLALIVAGSPLSAHAAAWACRSRGWSSIVIATAATPRVAMADLVAEHLPTAQRDGVIACVSLAALAGSTAVSAGTTIDETDDAAYTRAAAQAAVWLEKTAGLMLTLPDVAQPDALQPLTTPFIPITMGVAPASSNPLLLSPSTPAASSGKRASSATPVRLPNGRFAKRGDSSSLTSPPLSPSSTPRGGTQQQQQHHSVPSFTLRELQPTKKPGSSDIPPLDAKAYGAAVTRYHIGASTALHGRGDLAAFVASIARLYTNDSSQVAEDTLYGALVCDWGGAESAAHMHHKLATVLRMLVDSSIKLATSTKVKDDRSLAHVASRCVVRAVKHLPRLDAEDTKSAAGNRVVASPVLDCTLTYCFSRIPKAHLDELAEAWGLHKLGIVGSGGTLHADRLRAPAVHRIRATHAPRLGTTEATFAIMLHHAIADACMRHALNVKDIRHVTLWDFACAQYGDLPAFLAAAHLCHRPQDLTSKSGYNTDGVKVSKTKRLANASAAMNDTSFISAVTAVAPHPTATCPRLKRLAWPLLKARDRRRTLMVQSALDELLSTMPMSSKVPVFLGDVGNLIGRWTLFNGRFGGYLPGSLLQFLEQHPEHFRVVGNLVTRVQDSVTAPIKIRFDQYENDDDSDDERKKKKHRAEAKKISLADIRTRRGLKAAEKRLLETKNMTKRAAKKKMKGLRNRARFNKNQKALDVSARVPGYDKPTPRSTKGRGRKANKRTTKRG